MAEKFGRSRYKPAGEWVQTASMTEVVGWQHRRRDMEQFCSAVRKADRRGDRYGIRLEHQPANEHDANAIAVFGSATTRSLFRREREEEWHVGFVQRDLAAELVEDLVAHGHPVAAELYSIYISDAGFHEVRFLTLGPPGFSVKKRQIAAGRR